MTATHAAPPPVSTDLKLPEILLSDLPEATKDFLIGKSLPGKTIPQTLKDILNAEAANCGFAPTETPTGRAA